MSKLIRIARTLRRHWKKSTVGFAFLSYGVLYGCEKYRTFQLLRSYCEEAKKYGEVPQPSLAKPRHVTVILNSEANDKKAKSQYEKYAAPLLHLAGLKVSVIQTENAGQAADLMEVMDNTDAVLIAGGNGTLHEAVTGLLRRPDYQDSVTSSMPIGVIPVGKTNTVAKMLFKSKSSNNAEWLAEAAMSVIRESTQLLDVLKIERERERPLFALSSLELGRFPDLEVDLSKYWYFGPLKAKFAYFVNALKTRLSTDVDVQYVLPCDGCSHCFDQFSQKKNNNVRKWWSVFLPRPTTDNTLLTKDYSKIVNDECGVCHFQNTSFSSLIISTSLRYFCSLESSQKAFWITLFPSDLSAINFIKAGLEYHKGHCLEKSNVKQVLQAREAKLSLKAEAMSCYVDNEKHEAQQLHVTLLPERLMVYG